MRRRAFRLLEKHPDVEPVVRWHLADAERLAGNWNAAQAEAETALRTAVIRNDREIERLTRLLLHAITGRRGTPPRTGGRGELRDFLRVLAARLSEWSPRSGPWPGPWGEDRAA
jgi:hypothetical protein